MKWKLNLGFRWIEYQAGTKPLELLWVPIALQKASPFEQVKAALRIKDIELY